MKQPLITIIGAGASGIGMGTALKRLGIHDFLILDKEGVGSSFHQWSPSTHFISPSFNTGGFGFPDLNAITPDTSPGVFAQEEHIAGKDYANYLYEVAQYFKLPVHTGEEVTQITPSESGYMIKTTKDTYMTKYLITALGDFSFPDFGGIKGAEDFGIHYNQLGDYSGLEDADTYHIIGGNESAFDIATQLAHLGKESVIHADDTAIDSESFDPSQTLSLYTQGRLDQVADSIQIRRGERIREIAPDDQGYQMINQYGQISFSETKPLLATGFAQINSPLMADLFDRDGNRAVLTDQDESTIHPNLFMVGPQVQHGDVILCYIYKYRQRFAYIADVIGQREGIDLDQVQLQVYKDNQMYLDHLTNCSPDCAC